MAGGITNKDLMEAIASIQTSQNNLRLELKGDIKAVDDKVNSVMTAQAVDKTKLGSLISGISIIVSAVVTVAIESLKKGH